VFLQVDALPLAGLKTGEIRDLPEDIWVTDEEQGHGRGRKGGKT
jgi:hypothetical protein